MHYPLSLVITFVATTVLAIAFFQWAAHQLRVTLTILVGWALLQGAVSTTGFYLIESGIPPRFVLLVGPPMLLILLLFLTAIGKRYIDGLDASRLTLLHMVRIPVELVLYGLFLNGAIPEVMTFEGRNFDVISGLTAPLVYYFGFVRPRLSRSILIGWNIVCLALLVNVVTHAVLAAPTDFQRIAFDKPNVGVLYFPFVWLPCLVVPLVLFAHLVSLRRLLASTP